MMADIDTTSAIISLLVLVVVFLIGTVSKLQMGIAAVVAATIVGPLLFGESVSTIESGFPLSLFFTLIGVTYLFSIATNNGTVNWIVAQGLRLVGGHALWFPFVMFFVTALLTAIGAATPAAAAILMPIALSFARRNDLNPLPMAQAIIQGATAGSFSPMGVYGIIVDSVVMRSGEDLVALYKPLITWGLVFITSFIIFLITWLIYRQAPPANEDADPLEIENDRSVRSDLENHETSVERIVTIVGIALMAVLVLVFGLDVGLTALAVGAVLTLLFPKSAKGSVGQIAWPTILLVGGIVTYVSMLERQGIIEWIGHIAANLGDPKLATIIILLVGAIVSAFASTTGILGALIPLSVPFLVTVGGIPAAVSATMLIAALSVSSSAVDVSPFSTNGALAVANSSYQSEYVYRRLFVWCWILIFLIPLLTWAILILPPWEG
ncbi:SLC13 family permease [Actinomycetaceae bacterium MB13-C1-2]|nr:SLC13 family permease [Actinomycetaceae bacterium MB13-C1-2]